MIGLALLTLVVDEQTVVVVNNMFQVWQSNVSVANQDLLFVSFWRIDVRYPMVLSTVSPPPLADSLFCRSNGDTTQLLAAYGSSSGRSFSFPRINQNCGSFVWSNMSLTVSTSSCKS